MEVKIVSYYTDLYEWDAKQLLKSLNRRGITNYSVERKPQLGKWAENTQYKAMFIRDQLLNERAVLWTDADSVLTGDPSLIDQITGVDLAVHYMQSDFKLPNHSILDQSIAELQGFLQSGTMYFCNTPRTRKLLEKWIDLNEKDKTQWDQWTLQVAINNMPDIKVLPLPPEYVYVNGVSPVCKPVFTHMQASRKYKKLLGE